MSHSTTATSTYTLKKYSRSYPTTQTETSSEWQHFLNPTINLILDVKKAATSELESVRLRIIWSMSLEDSSNQVVFEDMELLAFSALPMSTSHKKNTQGLPLKAVYRDCVVGIRYLFPLDLSASSYRRFQITFSSVPLALEFIDSIRNVCPCKANPNTALPTNLPTMMNSTPVHPAIAQMRNMHYMQTQNLTQLPDTSIMSSPGFNIAPTPASHRVSMQMPNTMSMLNNPFISQFAALSCGVPSTPSGHHDTQLMPAFHHGGMQAPDCIPTVQPHRPAIRLQSTLSRSSRNQDEPSQPRPTNSTLPPSSVSVTDDTDLLASIQNATGLHSLPSATLEQLVVDVIREEGFAELMEKLSGMWKIKCYLG